MYTCFISYHREALLMWIVDIMRNMQRKRKLMKNGRIVSKRRLCLTKQCCYFLSTHQTK